MKIFVPPIKSQGIKTKLAHWINEVSCEIEYDRWVEPFMGTGVVAFNVRPKKALLADSNPHIVKFYQSLQDKSITSKIVKSFLEVEGQKLLDSDGAHYYDVRSRFNDHKSSLDFLFLSRSCFNGMMRFNKKGGYNVPFCKKPNRFAQALVTKITNQVKHISQIIEEGNYIFQHKDFSETLSKLNTNDLIYADPPYLGRNVDYFDSWDEKNELLLKKLLLGSDSKYIISTWFRNKYRTNDNIKENWNMTHVLLKEHFYHVGASESNRNAVYEALLLSDPIDGSVSVKHLWNNLDDNKIIELSNLRTRDNNSNQQLKITF
jgi:DNA adenine methylase